MNELEQRLVDDLHRVADDIAVRAPPGQQVAIAGTPAQHGARGPQGCTLTQLRVSSGSGGGAMGTYHAGIRLRNTGTVCVLDPRLTVLALDPASGVAPVRLDLHDQHGRVPLLRPGADVQPLAVFPSSAHSRPTCRPELPV